MEKALTVEELHERVQKLEAEIAKLREWKSRAIAEYDPMCCGVCGDFVEGHVDDTYCMVCQKYHCRECWNGNYETVRRPDADPNDTFDVCHKCVQPVCGMCVSPRIKILCPKKNCEEGFCSMGCYQTHCKKIDDATK